MMDYWRLRQAQITCKEGQDLSWGGAIECKGEEG